MIPSLSLPPPPPTEKSEKPYDKKMVFHHANHPDIPMRDNAPSPRQIINGSSFPLGREAERHLRAAGEGQRAHCSGKRQRHLGHLVDLEPVLAQQPHEVSALQEELRAIGPRHPANIGENMGEKVPIAGTAELKSSRGG